MSADTGQRWDASERAERILVRTFSLFRMAAILQVGFGVGLAWSRMAHPGAIGILSGVVMAESGLLVIACWRHNRIVGAWATGDVAFTIAALIICTRLSSRQDFATWANFMYPFSIIEVLIIGLGLARISRVLALTLAMAAAYVLSAVFMHNDPAWNTLPNAVTYFANAGVSWLVANELRRTGHLIDQQRRLAVDQATRLTRAGERARSARLLHDRVLQTLELLAHPPWIADDRVRRHVAAQASWLRRYVERGGTEDQGGLLDLVHEVCDRHARAGLQVDVNDAEMRAMSEHGPALSPDALAALAGALDEALTNVAKHSHTTQAMVRVGPARCGIIVSVLDHGTGFDPVAAAPGFGLRNSIMGRIRDVGGQATMESAPAAGTHVEMWVPLGEAGSS